MQIYPIREAIADAASGVVMPAGIGGLVCTGFTPDSVTVPHFFVAEYDQQYDLVMNRAMDRLEFTCRLFMSRADDRSGQKNLDALLSGSGAASLKEAIEASRSPGQGALGGLIHDLRVTRIQGNRWYEYSGIQYIGAEIIVEVIGDGSV